MAIQNEQEFEKVRTALKAGKFANDPELQDELISQAQAWKASQIGNTQPPEIPIPQGGSVADSLGKGLTFGFADEIAGAGGAAVNSALNLFGKGSGEGFGDAYRGIRDAARSNESAFRERNPGTAFAAEMGGGLLTGGVGAAKAGAFAAAKNAPTMLGKLTPAIKTGLTQGGIYGAGQSEADTARGVAKDTLIGAGIGGATAPLLPALFNPVAKGIGRVAQTVDSPEFHQAAKRLVAKTGVKLTTGQKTGSEPLRATETTLAGTFFGGSISRRLDSNRQKVQTKLMQMSGFADDDAAKGLFSRDAMDRAGDKFSERYASLTRGKQVDLATDKFIDDIATIQANNTKLLPPFQKKQINDIVDSFVDEAISGPMTGDVYQVTRSRIGQLAASQKNSNPVISNLYRDLKHALDDAFFESGGNKLERKALDQQYGRFRQLRDTFQSTGGVDSTRGQLPFSMIAKRAAKQPDREFEQIIRDAQAVLGDPRPNSDTASRLANLFLLGGQGGSVATGGLDAGLMSVGLPLGSAMGLSRGVTGGQLGNRLGMVTAPVTTPLFGQLPADPEQR